MCQLFSNNLCFSNLEGMGTNLSFSSLLVGLEPFWNPTIYNIISWFAGPMGQPTRQPGIWHSKYFSVITSYGLKTLYFHFCSIIKKIEKKNERVVAKNFARLYEKKILGTSDAWLTSHLSHRPNKPVYHIVDCRISNHKSSKNCTKSPNWLQYMWTE